MDIVSKLQKMLTLGNRVRGVSTQGELVALMESVAGEDGKSCLAAEESVLHFRINT